MCIQTRNVVPHYANTHPIYVLHTQAHIPTAFVTQCLIYIVGSLPIHSADLLREESLLWLEHTEGLFDFTGRKKYAIWPPFLTVSRKQMRKRTSLGSGNMVGREEHLMSLLLFSCGSCKHPFGAQVNRNPKSQGLGCFISFLQGTELSSCAVKEHVWLWSISWDMSKPTSSCSHWALCTSATQQLL